MFAEADLSLDDFLCGRLSLWQPVQGYRAATDPVLLAASVPARPGQSVLDLGCGAGAASLCLGWRVRGLQQAGLEIQPDYAELARRNAQRNGMTFEVVTGDLGAMPIELRRDFDHVIANPPYYHSAGSASPNAGRDTALRVDLPLAEWVRVGAKRLAPGGWLTIIALPENLPDLLAGAEKLGSISILPLAAREGRAAKRMIFQARKGGKGALRLLAPFVLHQGPAHDGDRENYTPQANAVLRDGADLLSAFR
jgi:tRNA1Val (adenine37-N6)-methyltransferase